MSGGQTPDDADYYTDDGRVVFTARYLMRRGYCCQNGCRHCPYGYTSNGGLAADARRRENDSPA